MKTVEEEGEESEEGN